MCCKMLRDIYNQADNTDTDHFLKIPFQKIEFNTSKYEPQ